MTEAEPVGKQYISPVKSPAVLFQCYHVYSNNSVMGSIVEQSQLVQCAILAITDSLDFSVAVALSNLTRILPREHLQFQLINTP